MPLVTMEVLQPTVECSNLTCLQALEIIPYTLAENAGINPIQMVTELRNRHSAGDYSAGINVKRGTISDMWAEHVVQPLLVNTSEITLATECVGQNMTNQFSILVFSDTPPFVVFGTGMILKIGEKSYYICKRLIFLK